jgi:GNAT superfamily N-acetyltransferase
MLAEGTAADVLSVHRDRLRHLDPMLPGPTPLPAATGDGVPLTVPGATGLARRIRVAPGELVAAWGRLDQHWLQALVTGPAGMAALLARWRAHLAELDPPTGPDSAAIVAWPSRDVAMTSAFVEHGLVPDLVIAVRPARRPTPATSAAVPVRRATSADLETTVALSMQEVRFGAQLNGLPERPNTAALMRARYADALAAEQPWVWLAEQDGAAAGVISVAVGEQAAWVAPHVALAPVAYLDCASVAPTHRGSGIGAALIRHVHDALDQAGIAVTALHYAALNPLSAPFWHRSGYRPLRTRWQTSPAR